MHTFGGGMQIKVHLQSAYNISLGIMCASCHRKKHLAGWVSPLALIDIILNSIWQERHSRDQVALP